MTIPFSVGETLKERYIIQSNSPFKGGAGNVYEARDIILERRCAIKTLREDNVDKKEYKTTFDKEIEHLMLLHHQNVINIIDYGEHLESKQKFYVMEFADGGDLDFYIAGMNKIRDDLFLPRLLRGLVEGLAYIHKSGRLHLDIKPPNILFVDQVPKISDLGVTKQINRDGNSTYVRTTTEFTHPDLLALMRENNNLVSNENLYGKYYFDLYALGITLSKIIKNLKDGVHHRQFSLFSRIVDRLMEKSPFGKWARYLTTQELLGDIAALDVFYLQPAGVAELAPAFINTSPCRIPPFLSVPLSLKIKKLVDSPQFQRLRTVPQLEGVHFVYPGAMHSRFEHSLGTYQNEREILNALLADPVGNVLLSANDIHVGLTAAILNDLGAYPFSHILEEVGEIWPLNRFDLKRKIVMGEIGDWDKKISEILKECEIDPVRLWGILNRSTDNFDDRRIDKLLHSSIHGTLGANWLDFLERDSLHCGVPYGMMADKERLFASLAIDYNEWSVGVTMKGVASAESYVLALCTMFTQVYWHHTVRSFASMLKASVGAIPAKNLLRDEALTQALLSDGPGLLRWLRSFVPMEARCLIDPLIPGAKRSLYKRVFTLRPRYPQRADSRSIRIKRCWRRLSDSGLRTRLMKDIRGLLAQHFRCAIGEYDFVIDVPDLDTDVLTPIAILDPEPFNGPIKGSTPFSLLAHGHLDRDLFDQFSAFNKKARIFVKPELYPHDTPRDPILGAKIFSLLSQE